MRSDGSAGQKSSTTISTLGGAGAHEYKGQFLQAVSSRKVVERDAALLANRIKLLRVRSLAAKSSRQARPAAVPDAAGRWRRSKRRPRRGRR